MNSIDFNNSKASPVQTDLALNKYADQVLFPEKVAKANEVLKKVWLPKKTANRPNEAA